MYSRLMSWSRYVYLAGIVLAMVMVIPAAWFPFQLGKVVIFSVLALVALLLLVIGGGAKEFIKSHGLYGVLLVALLPLAYLVSKSFSVDPSVGLLGFGLETDTVLFTSLAFIAFLLSFVFFKTLRTVRLLLSAVFWTLVVAMVFQWVVVIFGTAVIPFQAFSDRSVNLIGKWNDLGLMAGLLTLLLLVRAELSSATVVKKGIIAASCAVLVVLLGIVNFSLTWVLLLVFSIALGVIRFITQKWSDAPAESAPQKVWIQRIPWFSAVMAVVSIAFLFFGSALNVGLTNVFPISSLEVRPSYSSTLGVVNNARGDSFSRVLFGTGPNTFGQAWLTHKPAEVNQSVFWNLDFNVGFSTFVTALGTVGILGILAWLIPIFLVLAALVRAIRLSVLAREDKIVATTLGIASLFLLATILFYVPSQNIVLLSFVIAGATFGFLWRQGQTRAENAEESPSRIGQMVAMVFLLVLVVIVGWTSFASAKRLMAQSNVQQGVTALNTGNADDAIAYAKKAQGYDTLSDALRLQVDASSIKLQQIANDKTLSQQDAQARFAALVQDTINAGKLATQTNPNDYRNDMSIGRVYDYLSSLKIQGAHDNARAAYDAAAKKDPTNPAIPLALARLEATQGNQQLTSNYVTQALTLKPNYTDAILFVVQLNVANNDIPNAIRAATAAAQTAPGVASIWFQLGLLYYAAGDTKSAIPSLEQAVTLVPDYANAKYFLGLSYYSQKRPQDAAKQFQDLYKSNPDSAEVKLILSNILAGKGPFDGATPPTNQPPQSRTTAPLSQ